MEDGRWRPAGQGEAVADPAAPDWRSQLQQQARQRIVNKIMDTLKKHLPVKASDGCNELKKIAMRFEEKIYTAAISQSDYLRKISLKMLSMETKNQNAAASNPSSTNLVGNQSIADPALLGIQSQISNQGQLIPMVNQSPAQQALLPQNISKTAPSTTMQNSISLPPPMQGVTQNAMSHIGANSNLQNVSSMPQNSINSIAGQGATPNIYNSQRQMQGRTQPSSITAQQHQQQAQNPIIYQQQLQQQLLKQKLTHPSLVQPHTQQQQQSLVQQNQLQPSQQSLVQSNIPAGQSNIQQTQPTMLQTVQKSGLQNQQNSMQQPSLLQQHPQSIGRQQQSQPALHQQSTSFQQQPSVVPQQALLSSQQQQLMGQQSNMLAMQHNQFGQQNNAPDLQQQQQRLPGQQNSLSSVQQRQQILNQQSISLQQQQHLDTENNLSGQQQQLLGQQSNLPGLQQQQQQQQTQLLGSQPGIPSMQPHQMLQPNKTAIQRTQQPSLAMLQSQNQQSQHPAAQQQLMPQISSQPGQLQQQASSIQREMHQRLQTSGALLQSQNVIEQQKQFIQPQRGLSEVPSSASLDSAVPTSNTGAVDWQEEIYQRIKSMRDLYFVELEELFQKISLKFQQHESLLSGSKQLEHLEKMKHYKTALERTLVFLQIPKANIQPGFKEKLPLYEKQILGILASSRGQKNVPSQSSSQPPGQPSGGHTQSTFQQRSSQVPQLQQNDNVNQVRQMNLQGSATSMQPSATPSMPHGSLPLSTQASVSPAQQSMVASSQNTMNGPQQTNNIHTLAQSSINTLPNMSSMQLSTNILQQQHLKQQQEQQQQPHLMQSQQFTQLQQRHTQQQMMQQQQKQQVMQQQLQPPAMQQQLLQQQKQQQTSQLPVNQMAQINQVNEEVKLRQGAGMKSGLYQQHFQGGQRHNFYLQQQKSGSSLPSSSPQHFHISSPQISQQPSPQIDQQSLSSSLPKTGTPLQATSSPFVVPSPTTAIAPSPVPVDSEKPLPHVTLLTSAVGNGPQQTNLNPSQSSIAVGTPGISASPLLAEFVSPDAHQPNGPVFSGKPGVTEKPLERLVKVLQSISPEVLCSSVSDIGTVISMTDRIAGSAPCNGSRAAVGEDLVAMTKCRLQARNFMSQDGSAIAKKMKRHLSAMPLTVGSAENSFIQSDGRGISESKSTVTPRVKRQKAEVSHTLLDEITEINNKLIGTVVSISDEDVDPVAVAAAGSNEGTVIKCSYSAVALSPSLKSHFASAQVSPILPLKLLVPPGYPNCSPILLDRPSVEPSQDGEDLSTKAKSRFSTSLRGLPQPISLREMACTWDACTQKVISEYAQQTGGGVFSSKYGAWENCVSA